MSAADPKREWTDAFLEEALSRLYANDPHLLQSGQERPAAACLATHLTDVLRERGFLKLFPAIRINSDYGQEGNDPKRDAAGKQVVPDVIVHVPGPEGPNIAAIEMKAWWSRGKRERDLEKLAGYLEKQKYAFAYFVNLGKKAPTVERL